MTTSSFVSMMSPISNHVKLSEKCLFNHRHRRLPICCTVCSLRMFSFIVVVTVVACFLWLQTASAQSEIKTNQDRSEYYGNMQQNSALHEIRDAVHGEYDQKSILGQISDGADTWIHLGFGEAFFASFSMIVVSEIGDKTFFIAAVMAMKNKRSIIFSAAMSALLIMTILSAAMGFALPNLLPRYITHAVSTILFVYFGLKLLYDAYCMSSSNSNFDELGEVEEELAASKDDDNDIDIESGKPFPAKKASSFTVLSMMLSPIFVQCFTMTFLAEWGDRSQIATIALAADKNVFGITFGGLLGHFICTGLAVIGGKMIATRISERTISFIGGILFLLFAVHAMLVRE